MDAVIGELGTPFTTILLTAMSLSLRVSYSSLAILEALRSMIKNRLLRKNHAISYSYIGGVGIAGLHEKGDLCLRLEHLRDYSIEGAVSQDN